MNHPKRDEWVPYLFNEAPLDTRQRLKAHLGHCAECREEIDRWERNLGRLDAWKLPPDVKPRPAFEPVLKWAAAAAIVLAIGFSIGRLTTASASADKMRATIEPEIRRQLRQELAQMVRHEIGQALPATLAASAEETRELLAEYATAFETRRAEDNRAISVALDKLDSQRLTDILSLKKELDTVAVNTDAGLRNTEQQLVQMADYAQPARFSSPSPK